MTGATFTIHRDEDVTGISGTGVIAEGWESSDGKTVVLLWLTDTPSVCVYSDVRHIERIHGHGGKTRIVWDTPQQYTPHDPETPPSLGSAWERHDDPEMNR